MFGLCHAYFIRGSVREAEYFAQQAEELAQALNAPAMVGRAIAKRAELQLHQGLLKEGYSSVTQAIESLQDLPGLDMADAHRLRGEYNQRTAQDADAKQNYELSKNILEEFDQSFGLADGITFGFVHSSVPRMILLSRQQTSQVYGQKRRERFP